MEYLFEYQRLVMPLNDVRIFELAFECSVGQRQFNKDKVRDAEHLRGK